MKNKKTLKVGILGMGTVGSELVSLIMKNTGKIEKETGKVVSIEKILVRTTTKTRSMNVNPDVFTTDVQSLINNPEIDIICECLGGNAFLKTKEHVKAALFNGKHVIMASKKALAHYAGDFISIASSKGVLLKYDACVGGGIPIAKVLESAYKGEKINRIMGIFNATSNFIYSNMALTDQRFDDALKIAQEKGYAENDPSDDVDGIDSMNKMIILGLFGMQKWIHPQKMKAVSFRNIDVRDMQHAKELGYQIKPLALLKAENGNVEYKIGPCLVPNHHIVANTWQNFNSIIIEGDNSGEYGFYGQGAGAKPTAGAMFDDLLNLIKNPEKQEILYEEIETERLFDYQSNLYWRFTVPNKPGILAIITGVFATKQINIEKIIQKEEVAQGIEIVFLTSNAKALLISEIKDQLFVHKINCNSVIPFV